LLKGEHVKLVGRQPQPVSGWDVVQVVTQAEILAQCRDIDLKVLVRRPRRCVVPGRLDERGHRNHIVDPDEQRRQERAPFERAEVELDATPASLKGPENGELHARLAS
jgi:hypothetical protein